MFRPACASARSHHNLCVRSRKRSAKGQLASAKASLRDWTRALKKSFDGEFKENFSCEEVQLMSDGLCRYELELTYDGSCTGALR